MERETVERQPGDCLARRSGVEPSFGSAAERALETAAERALEAAALAEEEADLAEHRRQLLAMRERTHRAVARIRGLSDDEVEALARRVAARMLERRSS